jgi:hypothetical protein
MPDSDILTIIIDSMDKSKFPIPRWDGGRVPKVIDGLHRPVLTITAAIAHGYETCVFIQDESLQHGSDNFLEILFRTIERVYARCKATGRRFPRHLVVQAGIPRFRFRVCTWYQFLGLGAHVAIQQAMV